MFARIFPKIKTCLHFAEEEIFFATANLIWRIPGRATTAKIANSLDYDIFSHFILFCRFFRGNICTHILARDIWNS